MKFNSKSRTRKILVATWLLPALLASPYTFNHSFPFVISSHMGSIARQICNDRFDEIDALMYGEGVKDRFRRGFFIFLFLVIYLLPMLVILATCVRIAVCLLQPIAVRRWPSATGKDSGRRHEENKRKVARMVIVVAVAFIVSWSPFYLCTMVTQIQSISTGHHFMRERNFLFTMLMINLIGFLNSCINPLIYTGMSKRFRRSFKMILSSCICCRLTYRFLRYRDSLTRGTSAAFTSSLRHSMTEVRDANDLALSEAGSSSGEGGHHIVRPSLSHGSLRSHGANGSSLRHHHHHHHRQQNHQRRYNLACHDPTPADVTPLSVPPSEPEMMKSKSCGFKLWKASDKRKEISIELSPLEPKDTMMGKYSREEDAEDQEVGEEIENTVHDSLLPANNEPERIPAEEEEEENQGDDEDDREEDEEEDEASGVEIDDEEETKLLANACAYPIYPDNSSDPREPAHHYTAPWKASEPITGGGQGEGRAGEGGPLPDKRGLCVAVLENGECPTLAGGVHTRQNGGDKLGTVLLNGNAHHILKDGLKDSSADDTHDFLVPRHSSSGRLSAAPSVVQADTKTVSKNAVADQHGALFRGDFGLNGQCVRL